MICTHLKELYSLCEKHELRLGGADLIRIVCKQCEQEETCPSMLMEDYEESHPDESKPGQTAKTADGAVGNPSNG